MTLMGRMTTDNDRQRSHGIGVVAALSVIPSASGEGMGERLFFVPHPPFGVLPLCQGKRTWLYILGFRYM